MPQELKMMPESASVKVTGALFWARTDGTTAGWVSVTEGSSRDRQGLHLHDAAAARAPTKREEDLILGYRYWFASSLPAYEHTKLPQARTCFLL
jgi:hypothetical protein